MEQYSLQPGPLEILSKILYKREPAGTGIAALDPIEAILNKMPSSYVLLKPVQVNVQTSQGNGSVTMQYVPKNSEVDIIEVNGGSIEEAERLMRSALGEAWRRCLVVREVSPNLPAIDEELSDLIKP